VKIDEPTLLLIGAGDGVIGPDGGATGLVRAGGVSTSGVMRLGPNCVLSSIVLRVDLADSSDTLVQVEETDT